MRYNKMENITTRTYHIRDNYYLDVQETDTMKVVYLYNTDFMIKDCIFGLDKPVTDEELFDRMHNTIILQSEIEQYNIDYMR